MGTWGAGPFDSDAVGDLLDAIRDGAFTFADLDASFEDDEYVDADGGQAALALVELALALHGQPHAPVPEADAVLAAFAPHLTAERARWLVEQADRVLADPDTSELYELWTEPGAEEWREPALASVARLRAVVDA
jgi:predicted metal-dependent hydrolase